MRPNKTLKRIFLTNRFCYRAKINHSFDSCNMDKSSLFVMFIPRREIGSISSGGSIEVSFHLLGWERYIGFQKPINFIAVFFPQNVLSPQGR